MSVYMASTTTRVLDFVSLTMKPSSLEGKRGLSATTISPSRMAARKNNIIVNVIAGIA